MKIRVLGVIPARYQSSRLPGKPLIPILGKTLIQRTYENACLASTLDKVIVATDDQRIFDHVQEFGGEAIMTSESCMTGTDRIAEILQQKPEWLECNAVVNIQGDEPCLDPNGINRAVQMLIDDPEAQMATLLAPLHDPVEAQLSSIVKCVKDCHGNALYFSRTLIPSNKANVFNPKGNYYRHIGLYVYRPHFVLKYQTLPMTPLQIEEDLEQLKVLEHGFRIKTALIDHASPGVDIPSDIANIERWLCTQNTSS